ncbi:MAG: hypothetical protein ACTHN5_23005 [Phycisphaerae bacterium]
MAIGVLGWKNALGEGPDFEINTVYDLLDVIERKPGLYLGRAELTALWHFYHGFVTAVGACHLRFEKEQPPFDGFHDFVASHYGWFESTSGWRHMILNENDGDEAKSLDGFYSLLSRYRALGTNKGVPAPQQG